MNRYLIFLVVNVPGYGSILEGKKNNVVCDNIVYSADSNATLLSLHGSFPHFIHFISDRASEALDEVLQKRQQDCR